MNGDNINILVNQYMLWENIYEKVQISEKKAVFSY